MGDWLIPPSPTQQLLYSKLEETPHFDWSVVAHRTGYWIGITLAWAALISTAVFILRSLLA